MRIKDWRRTSFPLGGAALLASVGILLWFTYTTFASPPSGSVAGDIALEVLVEDEFQPLDFSVVGGVAPTIRIRGTLPVGFRVWNDRPDSRAGILGGENGNGKEVTGSFIQTQPNQWEWEGPVNVLHGVNTILLTDASADHTLATATMLTYSPRFEDVNGNGVLDTDEDTDRDGLLDPDEDGNGNQFLDFDEDITKNGRLDVDEDGNGNGELDPGEDLNGNKKLDAIPQSVFTQEPEENIVILDMVDDARDADDDADDDDADDTDDADDDAGDAVTSQYLRRQGLRPIGISFNVTKRGLPRKITVLPLAGENQVETVERLNGFELFDILKWNQRPVDPPLEIAVFPIPPELFQQPHPVTGETLPKRLMDGASALPSQGNAGNAYKKETGGFDDTNDIAPGGDDDGDGKADEDPPGDKNNDGWPGAPGNEDGDNDGDGATSEADYNDPDYRACFQKKELHHDDDEDGRFNEDRAGDQNADGCPGTCGTDSDNDQKGKGFSDQHVMAASYDGDATALAGPDGKSGAGPDGDFGFGPNGVDDAPAGPGGGDDRAAVGGPGNDPWDDNIAADMGDNDTGDIPLAAQDEDEDGKRNEDPDGDQNNDNWPGVKGADDDGDGLTDFDDYQKFFVFARSQGERFAIPVDDDDEDGMLDGECDRVKGFNEDGSLADRFDYDELDIAWPHFFMETYGALALAEEITRSVANPTRPGIAIVDEGLHDGADAIDDLPFSRLLNIADVAAFAPYKSVGAHGLTVATLAAGEGKRVMGTGLHAAIKPYRIFGPAGAGKLKTEDALTQAANDNRIQVVNLSFGLGKFDTNKNGLIDDIPDEDNDGKTDEDDPSFFQGGPLRDGNAIDDDGDGKINEDLSGTEKSRADFVTRFQGVNLDSAIDLLHTKKKIVVKAAGNDPYDLQFNDPGPDVYNVPERGTRKAGDKNEFFMAVSATDRTRVDEKLIGPEARAAFSNFGKRVSVSAPGKSMVTLLANQKYVPNTGGTSWSAPYTSGATAEILFMDDNRPGGKKLDPLKVVQLIEATADDLGTTVMQEINAATGQLKKKEYPNDNPGNENDDFFGYGRINAWKAMLSAVNAGLAKETHERDKDHFKSLALLTDAQTDWYGFTIMSPVKGATVWLDGRQLKVKGADMPDPQTGAKTKEITAYKGVVSREVIQRGIDDDNDKILDEDPTSGVVPVGTKEGEYLIAVSIQRKCAATDGQSPCLIAPDGKRRTLSLRRPGQNGSDAPFLNLDLNLEKMRKGDIPGVAFDDFVFEVTPVDYSDRQTAQNLRAWHLNTNLEWLGKPDRISIQSVSSEFDFEDSVDPDGVTNPDDRDRYDDGVVFFPLTYKPKETGKLEFTACTADAKSGRYSDDPDRSMFVNGWIDWDTNGKWDESGGEHVVDGLQLNPGGPWKEVIDNANVEQKGISPEGRCATYTVKLTVPATIGKKELSSRFRADYGENLGRNDPKPRFKSHTDLKLTAGPARFGEVEDYRISSDYGDAPDKGDGDYPTRKLANGARHLDIYKEWLQDEKTREPDACLKRDQVSADQDPKTNIGVHEENCPLEDQDGAEEFTAVIEGNTVVVSFEARSTIATRGYDLMGKDSDGDNRFDEDPPDGFNNDGDGQTDEDGPDEIEVASLDPEKKECPMKNFKVWSTPHWSGGKGRYHATQVDDDRDGTLNEDKIDDKDNDGGNGDRLIDEDPKSTNPLLVNIFIDWKGDGLWDGNDWVFKDGIIAPETFGKDGKYTLGEPFEDKNRNGVFDSPDVFDASKELSGVEKQKYTCAFTMPVDTDPTKIGWVRIRHAYAELTNMKISGSDGDSSELWVSAGLAHATEDGREFAADKGGALFGEVEDKPLPRIPEKRGDPNFVPPGGTLHYTIMLPIPRLAHNNIASVNDPLPKEVAFAGNLTCAANRESIIDVCQYDQSTHTVIWQRRVQPGDTVVVSFDVTIVESACPPTGPPHDPPSITNTAFVFNGFEELTLTETTLVRCETP